MKLLGLALAIAAALYGAMSLLLYTRQARLIFFPEAILESTPAVVGIPYEDVWIPVSHGQGATELIHGWWMPVPQGERGALLYFHGNGGNIGSNVNHAARFHRMGLSVLLVDYRGYGQSQGAFPQERTVFQDAQAAWTYLIQQRGYQPGQVMIFGHSLGGAIAIDLAVQQPQAAGLIVQGSFTSMEEMAYRTTPFGWLPIDWLLTQRFDSIEKVSRLGMPVFYIHGVEDREVPADMSQSLYEASPAPKRIWLVPNAGHNGLADVAGETFFDQIKSFLELSLKP